MYSRRNQPSYTKQINFNKFLQYVLVKAAQEAAILENGIANFDHHIVKTC